MALSLVTAPATEPITLAEAKAHLRLDTAYGEPAPTAPTVALASPAVAGNVDNGAHRYCVTFVTADGETDGGTISDVVTVADKTVNGKVELTAIPLGGSAVTQRKIYRTAAAGSTYLLLTTITNNTATTYTDNIADTSLGAAVPTTNTTADPIVTALITSARQAVETFTHRALITQTWDYSLDSGWKSCDQWLSIRLPNPPLISVTSVNYVTGGVSTPLTVTTDYTVSAPAGPQAMPGRVIPVDGVWPTTDAIANAVTVRYVAGYGAASAVPQPLKSAMKLMIGHWYEHRESIAVTERGSIVQEMPQAAEWLMQPYRIVGF